MSLPSDCGVNYFVYVNRIVEIGKQLSLTPPSMPELGLHWLAVDGVQPMIPENPTVLSSSARHEQGIDVMKKDEHSFPSLLSQEMQVWCVAL